MNRIIFACFQLLFLYTTCTWCVMCPVEDDPTNLARCVQIDVTAIVFAARGKDDLSSICALADRYMECFKTYTRGCVGFHFGEGSLTELQNIGLYCCNGKDASPDCPFNKRNAKQCFSGDSYVMLADSTTKLMKDVKVGDTVKTLSENGDLVDTDVIMIMDRSDETSLFLSIETYSNKSLRVSSSHLIPIPGGEYKYAKRLFRDDTILTYDSQKNIQIEDKIKSILIEPVEGYVAPLTMSGTILVNDILASCYAVVESHSLGHTVMAPVRWWYKFNQYLTNVIEFSQNESMNGTHWYPQFLASITEQYLSSIIKFN